MRVLAVEDEAELARLIQRRLRIAGFAADGVTSLEDARAAIRTARYDALILDLGLPDGDGMALLRELRRRDHPVPVLILTARDAPQSRVAGLDAGGDDYLVKPFYLDELVARIKALLRRPGHALGTSLEAGNLAFDTVGRQGRVEGRAIRLRRREAALLETLLRRSGQVVTRAVLEDGLYGFDEEVSPNAIEVNVHRLRRKLAEAGADVRIHTLRGVGYMLEGSAP